MAQKPNIKVKKIIKNARNVLTLPKENFCSMKHLKTVRPKLQWSATRQLTKTERKCKIQEFFQNLPKETLSAHMTAMGLRKSVSLGVNDVCRALEKEELACCLISGEAKPKLLVLHLIDLAKAKGVPVLVLNPLKEQLVECLGFSSLAIGFKADIINNSRHELNELCSLILRIFNEKYSYESDFWNAKDIGNLDLKGSLSSAIVESCKSHENDKIGSSCPQKVLLPEEIYLFRESTSYRVFKPNEKSSDFDRGVPIEEESNIVSFHNSSEDDYEVVTKKARRYYEPPTVRREQKNPNKVRKKKKKKK